MLRNTVMMKEKKKITIFRLITVPPNDPVLVDAGVPNVEDGCPNKPVPVGCDEAPKRPPVLGVDTPNVDVPKTLLVAGLAPKVVEPIVIFNKYED